MPKKAPRSTNGNANADAKSRVLEAGLNLHDRGFAVVPCVGKKPVGKWGVERLTKAQLRQALKGSKRNIAIALNQSELIDVECDSPEAEAHLQSLFGGKVPRTPTWRSSRGKHRLFRRPPGLPDKAKVEIDGIEFRLGNKPALSVVPPSVHPDGSRYKWLPGLSLDDVEPAALPAKVIVRLKATAIRPKAKQQRVGDEIANGTRNETLFRLACSMRSHGATHETIELALMGENERRCDPPLPDEEVRQIAKSAVNFDPGYSQPLQPANSLIHLISLTPPVLGEAAYHGFAGDFVRAVSPYTEATDAGILAHLLPAVGTIIGPGPRVWGGDAQPTRINTAIVGPTSTGRKGTSFVPVNKLMNAVDSSFWDEQCVRGLASGEGLIQKVSDNRYRDEEGNEQFEPVEKRLYVLEAEFSKVLAQTRREGNILSQVLREVFDSGNLQVLTRNPLHANNSHISITGHITPEELRKRFSEIDMANGFGNRFLWFYVESIRELPNAEPFPERVIRNFKTRLKDIINFSQAQRMIKRTDAADNVWRRVYSYLRKNKPGLHGAMLARGESIVLRLALIYALLDKSNCIERVHLEAALTLWQFNEESVRLIFANKMGDDLAEKIHELLANGPLETREFYRHLSKPAKEIGSALKYLESIGRVKQTKIKRNGPGRPAVVWERVEIP